MVTVELFNYNYNESEDLNMIQILENLRATFCVLTCIYCIYKSNELESIIKRVISVSFIITIAIVQLMLETEPMIGYHLVIIVFWSICLTIDIVKLIQVKRITEIKNQQ